MRLSAEQIRRLGGARGVGLGQLLRKARVSRTAYYSLARKDNVLPGSIRRIAKTLGVPPGEILVDEERLRAEARRVAEWAVEIAARNRGVSPENVRHTLILLRRDPIERLRGALTRAP